jgi:hypothetical protein
MYVCYFNYLSITILNPNPIKPFLEFSDIQIRVKLHFKEL